MVHNIAVDSGKVLIVWHESDGTNTRAFRSDYGITAANIWTHPVDLTDHHSLPGFNSEDENLSPKVAIDDNGNYIKFFCRKFMVQKGE